MRSNANDKNNYKISQGMIMSNHKGPVPVSRAALLRLPQVLLFGMLLAATSLNAQQTVIELADLERISESDTMVMVPMRDGVRLATDIYRPKDAEGKVPLIFVKTPYDFNEFGGSSMNWAFEAVQRGYAVAVQNERGRYYSEGDWQILGNPRTDGYDALTWFADQDWSNGAVGTLGCSSSAEWQMALAAQSHPAHKAMAPMAAGAGIGRVGEFHEQGNWYKGGVHQTLFTVWLVQRSTAGLSALRGRHVSRRTFSVSGRCTTSHRRCPRSSGRSNSGSCPRSTGWRTRAATTGRCSR